MALLAGCTSSPSGPPVASGQVTLDGVTQAVNKNTKDVGATTREVDVGLGSDTGQEFEFGVQWAPNTTTFDLTSANVDVLMTVGTGADAYNVIVGTWYPFCAPYAGATCTPLTGFAGQVTGSMTVDYAADNYPDNSSGVYAGKFDLSLTWPDGSGTNHAATASVSFENVLIAPTPL